MPLICNIMTKLNYELNGVGSENGDLSSRMTYNASIHSMER